MKIFNLKYPELQFRFLMCEKENSKNNTVIKFGDIDKIIEFDDSLKGKLSKKGVDIT